jgi:hypothetical protein
MHCHYNAQLAGAVATEQRAPITALSCTQKVGWYLFWWYAGVGLVATAISRCILMDGSNHSDWGCARVLGRVPGADDSSVVRARA